MKKRISFNVNFNNRFAYSLIAVLVVLLIGVSVYAFGTSTPSTFGHSAGELDLSGGVNGNVIFNGNLDVAGESIFENIKSNGNLDVASSIKIGSDVSVCTITNEGSIRYNPTDNSMQSCNGTSWEAFGTGSNSQDVNLLGKAEIKYVSGGTNPGCSVGEGEAFLIKNWASNNCCNSCKYPPGCNTPTGWSVDPTTCQYRGDDALMTTCSSSQWTDAIALCVNTN